MDLKKLETLYYTGEVYPPKDQLYRAIELCPIEKTKVVILGQDPYHGPGQANGLAFSVNKDIPIPPSLDNIFFELCCDLDLMRPSCGDLTPWAEQGVLLLNTVLTVERGKPMSHAHLGWETHTEAILKRLNEGDTPLVFILWGKKAQEKKRLIDNPMHLVIESVHPSPLSARKGFFGSKPFSKCNKFLELRGMTPINWRLE